MNLDKTGDIPPLTTNDHLWSVCVTCRSSDQLYFGPADFFFFFKLIACGFPSSLKNNHMSGFAFIFSPTKRCYLDVDVGT